MFSSPLFILSFAHASSKPIALAHTLTATGLHSSVNNSDSRVIFYEMRSILQAAVAAAALMPSITSAHYIFSKLMIGNTVTNDYEYVRQNTNSPSTDSPLLDVTSTDMRCNYGAQANAANTKTYSVPAGSTVGMAVNAGKYIIHDGPFMVYLSRAPTGTPVSQYDGSGDWFKIYELGISSANSTAMYWYATNRTQFTWQIPASTPPGDYLMRAEHIGLHQAANKDQAQFYMECAQLTITGGDKNAVPGPLVKIPGVYKDTDPNILINIYYPVPQNYTVPGPAVWPPVSGSGSVSGSSTSTAAAVGGGSNPTPSGTSTANGAQATMYGQCGGQGYTGPTTCPAGTTCQAQNQYYSQCLSPSSGDGSNGGGAAGSSSTSAPAAASTAVATWYGQCGGSGWTGATTCAGGTTCQPQNQYYSQCLPPGGDTKRRAVKGRKRRNGGA